MSGYKHNKFLPNKAQKLINILWESDYFPINIVLSQKLGLIKSIIIAEMLILYEEIEGEEIDLEKEYILFYPHKLSKELGLDMSSINEHIKLLEKLQIISIQNIEFPERKYYKINFDKLLEILSK